MKALPCSTCHKPAILPDGNPYHLQSFPSSRALTYKCSQCKRKTVLLPSEFARLPEVTSGEEELSGLPAQ